jgi:hypothetical protein
MFYTLVEYSYISGRGKIVGSNERIDELPWNTCNDLDTYLLRMEGSKRADLAEFEGTDVDRVYTWFAENPDYDGRDGVRAWRE